MDNLKKTIRESATALIKALRDEDNEAISFYLSDLSGLKQEFEKALALEEQESESYWLDYADDMLAERRMAV